MGFGNEGDALRMGPLGMPMAWGFANCALNWAGLPMKADGSIMDPGTADGSLRCEKPLPLWFGTAASLIQELMSIGGRGWQRQRSRPSDAGEIPCAPLATTRFVHGKPHQTRKR